MVSPLGKVDIPQGELRRFVDDDGVPYLAVVVCDSLGNPLRLDGIVESLTILNNTMERVQKQLSFITGVSLDLGEGDI